MIIRIFLSSSLIGVLTFLLSGFALKAQTAVKDSVSPLQGWAITLTFAHGKILKHTPKFGPAIETASNAVELEFSKQLRGRDEWQQVHHYPFLGVAAEFNDMGNDSLLGKAYWLLPFIKIPMVSGKKISAYFRVGSGLAWLTKHYDEVENPVNNVIASHLNDVTQFMMELSWRPVKEISLSLGGSLTHYSSGAVRIPNLGINTPAWRFGFQYVPQPLSNQEFIHKPLSAIPKKILFTAQTGLGFQESSPAHGPMYHVYLFNFSAGKMIRRWDLLSVGAELNYKEAASIFIKQQEIYSDHFFLHSLAVSGFVKNDFLFGNLGIAVYLGSYFYHPSPLQIGFYQKIGQYYAFPTGKQNPLKRLTAGVYLTAGNFTADFVSVELGFRF